MTKGPRLQPVYVSINKPLTIGGADRRMFFVALIVGGATFTLFGSLLAGLLMFLALYLGARWVTERDPQLLRIVLDQPRRGHATTPASSPTSPSSGRNVHETGVAVRAGLSGQRSD